MSIVSQSPPTAVPTGVPTGVSDGIPAGIGPEWTPAAESEKVLRPLLSPVVGIATRLYRQMHDTDDAQAFAVGARACESQRLLGEACAQAAGGGSLDERSAMLSALGEAAERYSAAYWPEKHMVQATWSELNSRGEAAISPSQLSLFSAEQLARPDFPYVPFGADTRISWVKGSSLVTGEPTWLPAVLVFLSGPHREQAERISHSTSNGIGAGCTWDEAVCSGLLELIERDAFCTVWHNRLSMPLIDPRSDPEVAAFFERHVDPTGLEVSLIDLSSFCEVPAVLTMVRNRLTDISPTAVGAAAAATPQRAIVKAVIEAFQTRVWMRAEQREGNLLPPDTDFDAEVHRFDDHVRLYAGPGLEHATEFLDESQERVAIRDLPKFPDNRPRDLVRALVQKLDSQGIDTYVADATSPDIFEAGMVVARVFAPALVPLDSSFRARFLGSPRLRQRPVELNLQPRALSDDELNPYPHPFP